MKKNFFKKLSFVMALAMMISVIAPAASAFGATSPTLNATKKYLYLNEEGKISDYDFNIKNKVAGSTYAWASDNEAVASVDDATGLVTAKAVGTANISVVITPKTGKAKTLKAVVVVRDNIETIDVVAPGTDFVVGKEYDFNRSFVTFNGSTKKTSSISRWAIDKGTIAADSGKVTFTEAGKYNVTVNAFQSTAKYEAWLTSKDASLVLATKSLEVVVSASVVSVAQVDKDTFKVTFDSDMSKTDLSKTTAVVAQVINGKAVVTGAEKVKALSFDATGKVATIDLYSNFATSVVYTFTYGKLTGSFTAATRTLADIAGVQFNDFNVDTSSTYDMSKSVNFVNKDGVIILNAFDDTLASYLTFTYGGDLTKGNTVGKVAYIYTTGYQAPVTVTYNNYVYDSAAQKYNTISFNDSAVGTGVVASAALTGSMQFEVSNGNGGVSDASHWGGKTTLAAGDTGYTIRGRYYTDASPSTYVYTNNTSVFTYVSSDTSKLVINNNYIYPVAAGVVTVLVKSADGKTTLGTFDVTVQAARSIASLTSDTFAVVVGNNATYGETKSFTVKATDSVGAGIEDANKNVWGGFVNAPNVTLPRVTWTELTGDDAGKITVNVVATGAAVGSYQYKLTVQYAGNAWDTKDYIFSINVIDSTTAGTTTVSYWKVDLGKTSVDWKANTNTPVSIQVNGYNSAGVVVDQLTTSEYTIVIKDAAGNTEPTYQTSIPVITGVSGSAVSRWAKDSYSVTAYASGSSVSGRVDGAYIAAASFNVVDTTATTWALEDSTISRTKNVLQIAQDAFSYKLNGDDINEANIVSVVYSTTSSLTTATGAALSSTVFASPISNVLIKEVVYRVTDSTTGVYIDYTYTLNFPVTLED